MSGADGGIGLFASGWAGRLRESLDRGDGGVPGRMIAQVAARAESLRRAPCLKPERVEGRMLLVSQEAMRRLMHFGVMHSLEPAGGWAEAGDRTLEQVCGFPDWNPGHSLDFTEMCAAVALGLDAFRESMDAGTVRRVEDVLVSHAVRPALRAFETGEDLKWMSPVLREFNWNLVCNSGLIVGALALSSRYRSESEALRTECLKALPPALANFAPGGFWPEGQDYWRYGLKYVCLAMEALTARLGHDAGLGETPGLMQSGWQGMALSIPGGDESGFSDVGERFARGRDDWPLFVLAARGGEPRFAAWRHRQLRTREASPEDLLFYQPPVVLETETLPRLMRLSGNAGRTEVAVYREDWRREDAFWWAVKTGYNRVNHGHMDLGSFELAANGVRWAVDLGTDAYSLPGTWDRHSDGGQRWGYFRYSSLSHNVMDIGGRNQLLDGTATMPVFDPEAGRVEIDLTPAYADRAKRVWRRFLQTAPRELRIQEEVSLRGEDAVRWTWLTRAEVTPGADGVRLCQADRVLEIGVRGDVEVTVASATRLPPEAENAGCRQIVFTPRTPTREPRLELCVRG